jgi:hypothetical protein
LLESALKNGIHRRHQINLHDPHPGLYLQPINAAIHTVHVAFVNQCVCLSHLKQTNDISQMSSSLIRPSQDYLLVPAQGMASVAHNTGSIPPTWMEILRDRRVTDSQYKKLHDAIKSFILRRGFALASRSCVPAHDMLRTALARNRDRLDVPDQFRGVQESVVDHVLYMIARGII